jgi:hypothetical protein
MDDDINEDGWKRLVMNVILLAISDCANVKAGSKIEKIGWIKQFAGLPYPSNYFRQEFRRTLELPLSLRARFDQSDWNVVLEFVYGVKWVRYLSGLMKNDDKLELPKHELMAFFKSNDFSSMIEFIFPGSRIRGEELIRSRKMNKKMRAYFVKGGG